MNDNVENFVDEKTSRKIINALTKLDFKTCNKLANDSGIPFTRLQAFIHGIEKITQLDKGKLILHFAELDMSEEKRCEDSTQERYSSLKAFQQRKAG